MSKRIMTLNLTLMRQLGGEHEFWVVNPALTLSPPMWRKWASWNLSGNVGFLILYLLFSKRLRASGPFVSVSFSKKWATRTQNHF